MKNIDELVVESVAWALFRNAMWDNYLERWPQHRDAYMRAARVAIHAYERAKTGQFDLDKAAN
jgi:hypothetical protein